MTAKRPISNVIRQWCIYCQKATVSWTDSHAHTHCSECDPETKEADK
jgi:hypothetical protein